MREGSHICGASHSLTHAPSLQPHSFTRTSIHSSTGFSGSLPPSHFVIGCTKNRSLPSLSGAQLMSCRDGRCTSTSPRMASLFTACSSALRGPLCSGRRGSLRRRTNSEAGRWRRGGRGRGGNGVERKRTRHGICEQLESEASSSRLRIRAASGQPAATRYHAESAVSGHAKSAAHRAHLLAPGACTACTQRASTQLTDGAVRSTSVPSPPPPSFLPLTHACPRCRTTQQGRAGVGAPCRTS